MKKLFFILVLGIILQGCGGGSDSKDDPKPVKSVPKVKVNSSLKVYEEVLSDTKQSLGVMSFENELGKQRTYFIKNELIVLPKNKTELQNFLNKYDGEIIETYELSKYGSSDMYLVKIKVKNAPTSKLSDNLKKSGKKGDETVEFSGEDGIDLFAISVDESVNYGIEASLNIVLQNSVDPTVKQAINRSTADYFSWDYLKSSGTHQTGVIEAWNLLLATDKLNQSVEIMVFDGGFQYDSVESMYPVGSRIEGKWNRKNRFKTSTGAEAPWHGTNVVATAMGQLYTSGLDVVGPAGPVAKLVAVDPGSMVRGRLDIGKWFKIIKKTLDAPLKDRPDIINISATGYIPAPINWFSDIFVDIISSVAKKNGVLVFASAGNKGWDVDSTGLFGIEKGTIIPCESKGVICVGGMQKNSTLRHPHSNYGREKGESVDIYAPYVVNGYDLNEDGSRNYALKEITGTSYSSPFVAGVAALVWAANKDLSSAEVEECLLSSAFNNNDVNPGKKGSQKRVNALGAVKCALDKAGITYPIIKILTPKNGTVFENEGEVNLEVIAVDSSGKKIDNITFSSNKVGSLETEYDSYFHRYKILGLTNGEHVITASVNGATDSVKIIASNEAPVVKIYSPLEHHIYYVDDDVYSIAKVYDNSSILREDDVKWSLSNNEISGALFSSSTRTVGDTGFYHLFTTAGDKLLHYEGEHFIHVFASDEEFTSEDETSINFLPIPKDSARANLKILLPVNSSTINKGIVAQKLFSNAEPIVFKGEAIDAEDGVMPGNKMVWTYTDIELGITKPLCSGGDKDCSNFTYTFTDTNGPVDITMEVVDSDGIRVQEHVIIAVYPPLL